VVIGFAKATSLESGRTIELPREFEKPVMATEYQTLYLTRPTKPHCLAQSALR